MPRAGAKMSYWIADVLYERREQAALATVDVARVLNVTERTIKRLETGRSMGRDIDRAVAGYAYLLGLDDGRELWQDALERWLSEGSPPQFAPSDGPAGAFAEAIRVASLRHQPNDAERSAARTATRKRRAAG